MGHSREEYDVGVADLHASERQVMVMAAVMDAPVLAFLGIQSR